MMAGERRNGNLLVHLGPQLQAYPEELIRQRCNHEGHTEYLIRWSICSLDEKGENGTTASTESKAEHILMWMSAEEVYANCPTLLGKRKPEGQWMKEEATPSAFPAHVPLDQEALQDMKNDVRTLVQRATKQMTQSSGPESSILNTIHVLSAYASIGSLAGVFRETGALDLLMKMLCNEEKQIRRSAGKMLRALASHDAGSRAYVLLSLSQQDGIEHHMDFDSRYTLLELFAETTSSEEHCISFEGIHLPQIPGKVLFSLVKRYLCVTSLMDNLNSSSEQGARRQDSAAASTHVTERSRVLVEFEFSMAMANLISELLRVLGWERVPRVEQGESRGTRSVIQPKAQDISGPHITSNGFKTRSDFSSRSSYARYVQENLKPGMSVRLLEEYEQVSRGEEGEYRRSNDGSPPVQVYWRSLARTYWVHWHMLELTSSYKRVEKETLQKACGLMEKLNVSPVSQVFYCRPHGSSYSLPYLMERVMEDSGTLSQSEWWELLFFIKKLEPQEQQEVNRIIRQDLEEQLSELTEEALIQLSVPVELAQKVLQFLNQHCQGFTLTDLHNSHIYIRYISQGGPEQDCLNGVMTSADYTGLGSPLSGVSKKPKKEAPAADNFPLPPPTAEKTDLELFQELFKAQGFQLPEVGEETTKDISVSFDFKDVDLLKLVSSLKESSLSKEIILALERCICEETALLDSETSNLMKDRDTFLMLLRNLEQLRMEKAVQMGVLRILTKLLDNYQDDPLPWHESIEPCLSSMTAHSNDRELAQEFICFLHRLATSNKDCAVVMCRLGMKEALTKALDKHSSNLLLVTELRDLVTDCEKYASLYKQMTTSILAGCIQMVFGQIEEHRRGNQSINIPFFDVFLRNLCQGSSMEVKEDKCWEKVEVSSNPHRANKLTDRNPKTYWESNGSTGSHYINIYMHRGVVIRQMLLEVSNEESSYMPSCIVVMGGENPSSLNTELNTVDVPSTASQVIVLEKMAQYWPVIQIRIKRCQQDGINARVRGIEVLGPKSTFWPVFKDQLCRRTSLFYTTHAHAWCQEISQDRMQLLQLFNKLKSALQHEQVFADHFLADEEAAQALGRTCWEALMNPVVQSITTPDASSLSPLCWLLTEYLENLELPRCTKCQAAIFNSCVRRLSHLLVHVDISRPKTVDMSRSGLAGKKKTGQGLDSAAVKEQGKLSTLSEIARCWQEVVQQQALTVHGERLLPLPGLSPGCGQDLDYLLHFNPLWAQLLNR
ncbi:cullin-9-like [Rhinatrema bivittatum]|uniref:cullin-9-like n=1 Tax=Rhinatrema bivittatum TaxID=194408 RepID=UPI00112E35C2|nr:cullin-9-like [Rhinatrema bivittatum]